MSMYPNYEYSGSTYPYPYGQSGPGAHHPGTPFPGYGGNNIPTANLYGQPAWGVAESAGSAPLGRPKHHSGAPKYFSRPQTPGRKMPLKSAMKRGSDGGTVPLARVRTTSDSRQSFSSTRSRQAPFVPEYLFLSFHGTDEFRMDNVASPDFLVDFKERVLPMWNDVVSQHFSPATRSWTVRFAGRPWNMNGYEGHRARRMICEIFGCLTRLGYSYLTSTNTSSRSTRLVFYGGWENDSQHQFFTASVSRSGRRFTFVDPPEYFGESLGTNLRATLRKRIASDRASEDGVYTIELKNAGFGVSLDLEKDVFATHTLKEINNAGYMLLASVPMARGGPLQLGSRKELWVFRSMTARHRRESERSRRRQDI